MAATVRVVSMRLYVGSKLLGECEKCTYTHMTNDDQGAGTQGADFFSTGTDMTTVEFDTFVPKAGHSVDFKTIFMNHKDVTFALLVDGGIESVTGRFESRKYDSDSKTGMLKGSFKANCGAPSIT